MEQRLLFLANVCFYLLLSIKISQETSSSFSYNCSHHLGSKASGSNLSPLRSITQTSLGFPLRNPGVSSPIRTMKLSFSPRKTHLVTIFPPCRMIADLNYNEARIKGRKQKHSMRFADCKSLSPRPLITNAGFNQRNQKALAVPVNARAECRSRPTRETESQDVRNEGIVQVTKTASRWS